MTLAIAAYILWHALSQMGPVVRILMLGAPPAEAGDIGARIAEVDGVADVHHVHLWQIDEGRTSVEAHVVAREGQDPMAVCAAVERALWARGITHSTLQMEPAGAACPDARGACA